MECIDVFSKKQCKTTQGYIEECEASSSSSMSSSSARMTVSGQPCVFPTTYRGMTLTDCTDIAGKSQCKSASGFWEECLAPGASVPTGGAAPAASPSPATSQRSTVKGNSCTFPLSYRGETYYNCISFQGKEQCKTSNGFWEECATGGSMSGPASVSGNACVFPVIYRGETLMSCTDIHCG